MCALLRAGGCFLFLEIGLESEAVLWSKRSRSPKQMCSRVMSTCLESRSFIMQEDEIVAQEFLIKVFFWHFLVTEGHCSVVPADLFLFHLGDTWRQRSECQQTNKVCVSFCLKMFTLCLTIDVIVE